MKIYAPVKDANGIWATVLFTNGVGETDNPTLIEWFSKHGYKVEEEKKTGLESMEVDELRKHLIEKGYGSKIRNTKDKEKLIAIAKE